MLQHLNLGNLLFLDIETVPEEKDFDALTPYRKELWEQKTTYQRKDDISAADFYERAGIWAEFGKIVCISVGFFDTNDRSLNSFRIKSFYGEEESLLKDFKALCDEYFFLNHLLCAHNRKEFDFPFISRRMIIHRIELPTILQLYGKKPWEVRHLDTLQLCSYAI